MSVSILEKESYMFAGSCLLSVVSLSRTTAQKEHLQFRIVFSCFRMFQIVLAVLVHLGRFRWIQDVPVVLGR